MFLFEVIFPLVIFLVLFIYQLKVFFTTGHYETHEAIGFQRTAPPKKENRLSQERFVCERRTLPASYVVQEDPTPSEVSNFYRLHFVYFQTAPAFLRLAFRDLWHILEKSEWTEDKKSAKKLLKLKNVEAIKKEWEKVPKEIVESGNTSNWDIQLLCSVLKGLLKDTDLSTVVSSVCEATAMTRKSFDTLKNIRNYLAHTARTALNEDSFEKHWKDTVRVLSSMGMKEEFLKIPQMYSLTFTEEETSASNCSESEDDEVEEFLKSGNDFFDRRMFHAAAAEYSKGIELENISQKLLTFLLSKRSISFLEAKYIKGAKEDAKSCVTIRPGWFQGYARLGSAYEKLKKFDKAMDNLLIAIDRGDSSKSTLESLQLCNMIIMEKARGEETDREVLRRRLCELGHRYANGLDGFVQDYRKSADYFSQAAAMEDAEGLLFLSRMTKKGEGVAMNVAKGHQLLLRAASKEPATEQVKGSGIKVRNGWVRTACHELGVAYENGEGVKVDSRKALEWYHKALVLGKSMSGMMIAEIHYESDDFDMAVDYWRLSAHLGTIRAMENIADHLIELGDSEGLRWHQFALHNRPMNTTKKKDILTQFPFLNMEDPEDFARLLENDVRAGILGPLLVKIEKFKASLSKD